MESLKGQVIRLFLEFISRHIPLGQAQLATLGGRGFEAKIWSELGIPNEHGWLIERSRERGGKLINNHRYRTQNQLGTFDRILAGYGEKRAFIDGFHLDLCGTLSNKAIADFAPALPLVLKSKGRCLAVTVADARRNLVLEHWPDFQKRAKRLFGKEAEDIYRELHAKQLRIPVKKHARDFIQPFDPEKATKREFGLLVELTELLRSQGFPWIPVTVERYVYVSRYQKRPFRMRTYFFRFESKSGKAPEMAFARAWVESQLFFANGEEFREVGSASVGLTPTIKEVRKGEKRMEWGDLDEFMQRAKELAGPKVMEEYKFLLINNERLHGILRALKGAEGVTVEHHSSANSKRTPAAHADTGSGKTRKTRKNWDDLSDREKIELQIEALELKAQLNGDWSNDQREKFIKEKFGHYNKATSSSFRAALARTNGGFRDMFKTRIQTVFGDEAKQYLDRLSKV